MAATELPSKPDKVSELGTPHPHRKRHRRLNSYGRKRRAQKLLRRVLLGVGALVLVCAVIVGVTMLADKVEMSTLPSLSR
jgi:hypothetical protein